jgi:putative ABC transport system permease protein
VLALAATRGLSGLLYDVAPHDPLVLGGVALLLAAIATLASFVPAWRATRVDPMRALRVE